MNLKFILYIISLLFLIYLITYNKCNKEAFWTQYDERMENVMILIKECAELYKDDKILKIPIELHDRGLLDISEKKYTFSYNKNTPHLRNYCGPDFTFKGWQTANIMDFDETIKNILNSANEIAKYNKVGWFGNIATSGNRKTLKDIGDINTDLFDIVDISPKGWHINEDIPKYMSLPDLVQNYKYLIDIEGAGWSGRLKFLLYSKRPLLVVDRDFVDYFYEDLEPFKHYIPVKNDLSDLVDKTKWIINNEDRAQEIANNAYDFAINNFKKEKLLERIYDVYKNLQN